MAWRGELRACGFITLEDINAELDRLDWQERDLNQENTAAQQDFTRRINACLTFNGPPDFRIFLDSAKEARIKDEQTDYKVEFERQVRVIENKRYHLHRARQELRH